LPSGIIRPRVSGTGTPVRNAGVRIEGGGFGVVSIEGEGRVDDEADMAVGDDGSDI
jgi:hypothetical protein